MQPTVKPQNPNFSSGPCAKRPGYDVAALQLDVLGRSHRSALGKKALGLACTETARLLGLPEGYRVAVVPASDTGAVEMAMWSLLGPRGVDVLAWESFGSGWVTDIVKQPAAQRDQARSRLRRHRGPVHRQLRQRRGLHLERHDLGRESAHRRLDPRGPRRPDDL
ncbi:hypothetical protein [Candidatus Skiveiella danica]|uniref:hypothetical protein n=1 Tax=Candidatus Skiveiella danica TaxID=3386177 RepID=UPI0039B8B114